LEKRMNPLAASRSTVQQKSSPRGSREKTWQKEERCRNYEPGGDSAGDSAGDSVVAAGDSVVVAGDSIVAAGDSTVPAAEESVADAGLLAAGVLVSGVLIGSTVSVFCSHAARSAAPARMQIYFFIGADLKRHIAVIG
jgi:hypothetical protein